MDLKSVKQAPHDAKLYDEFGSIISLLNWDYVRSCPWDVF